MLTTLLLLTIAVVTGPNNDGGAYEDPEALLVFWYLCLVKDEAAIRQFHLH